MGYSGRGIVGLPCPARHKLRVPKSDEEENRPPARRDDQRDKSGVAGSRPWPKDHGNAQSRRGNPAALCYRIIELATQQSLPLLFGDGCSCQVKNVLARPRL
jgi:hypothetical protein